MMNGELRCVTESVDDIGEGPLWSARDQALYWVDTGLEPKTLKRYRPGPGTTDVWQLPNRASSLMLRAKGGLVLGFQRGLAVLDPVPEGLANLRELPLTGVDWSRERFNDSAVDRAARWWVGSFERTLKTATGALYRVDSSLAAVEIDRGFMMSNGIAFSPDNRTLYFNDSRPGRIVAYDFDLASGAVTNRRVFMDFTGRKGRPDGCAMDSEGCLWVAEVDAWQIIRVAPDGRVVRELKLPIRKPTSIAFGGADRRTLYITSMTFGLDEAERREQKWAGRLLAVDAGVAGMAEPMLDW